MFVDHLKPETKVKSNKNIRKTGLFILPPLYPLWRHRGAWLQKNFKFPIWWHLTFDSSHNKLSENIGVEISLGGEQGPMWLTLYIDRTYALNIWHFVLQTIDLVQNDANIKGFWNLRAALGETTAKVT